MNFYQLFLPIAMTGYVLIVFVFRSIIVWKKTGVNPFVFGKTDEAHDFVGFVYKMTILVLFVLILVYSFFPALFKFFLPIWYLDYPFIKVAGLIMVTISFVLTFIAQYQMSSSWRIGISYNEKTALIDVGLFRYSRNPVFMGVLMAYAGVFLITPCGIGVALLCTTWVTISIQIRMEEAYLKKIHGSTYDTYCHRTRRWL